MYMLFDNEFVYYFLRSNLGQVSFGEDIEI